MERAKLLAKKLKRSSGFGGRINPKIFRVDCLESSWLGVHMASSRSRTNPSLVCVSVQVCLTQITSFVSKEFGVVSFTDRDLNAIMSFAAAFFLISVGFGGFRLRWSPDLLRLEWSL
ncbi:hypothetical protein DY000_02056035 [Brassica cretica]|uniref:Uncharacterized protein n=1 Tax=Brassica cretica TaxID=69181 RepID=A0ABQ7ACU7_BRACR|nr:hypothetical protein DY000_02056035 [Brassica cretica]